MPDKVPDNVGRDMQARWEADMQALGPRPRPGSPRRTTRFEGKVVTLTHDDGREMLLRLGAVRFWDYPDEKSAGLDVEVVVDVDRSNDGRVQEVVVSSVTFHRRQGPRQRPIGTRRTRDVPTGWFVREALRELSGDGVRAPLEAGFQPPGVSDATADDIKRMVFDPPPRTSTPRSYPVDELRFIAAAYEASSPRKRYEDIEAAYRTSKQYERPDREAIKARLRACRKRIDPDTGKTFLPPAKPKGK